MDLNRRSFTGGALSVALGSQLTAPAFAQDDRQMAAAFAAIRAFGEEELSFNHLPGMTLGIVTPDARRTVFNFGYANLDTRAPITSDTLFQIGSITKLMVAALFHQFAAAGMLRLDDRISKLLPQVPLPANEPIEVQHVLDHVAGLPSDAPMYPEGGLWTSYAPGAHWHYSNTGYEILGKIAEHVSGKSLAQLLRERIFTPLKMVRSRGAILDSDRQLYAQGYEAADQFAPYIRGAPLAPAPWVDVTFGAGCVASTANDMTALLESLASAAQGKGGLGLTPNQGRLFAAHAVQSDMPGMNYGNGLMHVGDNKHAYLHHTGGMLSSSSSFHVDVASGVGAFASATLNAFAEYRPRLLTYFAVEALTNVLNRRPLPPPPPVERPLSDAAAYVGRYVGPAGSFEVKLGSPLTLVADGRSAPLTLWSDEVFRTTHPQFRVFSLIFERTGGAVTLAGWGPNAFAREGTGATVPGSDPELAKLAGRYVNDNPWFGPSPVVERGGRLWIGTETVMNRVGENLWRVGKESWSPERASFADFIDGRPQTFIFSAVKFSRHNV